jgi:hypothetical protein
MKPVTRGDSSWLAQEIPASSLYRTSLPVIGRHAKCAKRFRSSQATEKISDLCRRAPQRLATQCRANLSLSPRRHYMFSICSTGGDAMTGAVIPDASHVEATFHVLPGLYLLGSLERGVTIYSQQVRAHNLAWALWELQHGGGRKVGNTLAARP